MSNNNNTDEFTENLDKNSGSVLYNMILYVIQNRMFDLTKVPLPTFILEKRSLLEMFADFMAYPMLFSTMGDADSSEERMLSACRWFFSSVSVRRGVKKPYNPIIGETFRCKWDMTNRNCGTLFYLAEQVSHHPPVSAFYVENRAKNITFNSHIHTKSQFIPPNSAGVGMVGRGCISLLNLGEDYIFTYPSAYARGILVGTLRFEMGDKVQFHCPQTGFRAEIEFRVKPLIWGEYHCVAGQISDPSGAVIYTLSGKWNSEVSIKDERTGNSQVLFSKEKFNLGEQPAKILTDFENMGEFESRKLWIEVTRALNDSDIDKATEFKSVLEKRQRAEQTERKEKNIPWVTKYFTYRTDIDTGAWIYNDTLTQAINEDASQPVSPSKDILTWDWKLPVKKNEEEKADINSSGDTSEKQGEETKQNGEIHNGVTE